MASDAGSRASRRQHTFQVRATDLAGNTDPTPAEHVWTIEAPPPPVPPETTLGVPRPDPVTVQTTATFTFTSDIADATFECSLDSVNGGAWESLHLAQDVHQRGGRRPRVQGPRPALGWDHARPDPGRVPVEGRLGARARHRLLRPGHHPEHQGPQRPARLSLRRPHRRRQQHHHRSRRPPDRRQGARRRHPQRRLRRRHHPQRPGRGLRLRRHAQRRHHRQHRRVDDGRAQSGGRHRSGPRASAARPGPAGPGGPAADLPIGRHRQHPPPEHDHGQQRSASG